MGSSPDTEPTERNKGDDVQDRAEEVILPLSTASIVTSVEVLPGKNGGERSAPTIVAETEVESAKHNGGEAKSRLGTGGDEGKLQPTASGNGVLGPSSVKKTPESDGGPPPNTMDVHGTGAQILKTSEASVSSGTKRLDPEGEKQQHELSQSAKRVALATSSASPVTVGSTPSQQPQLQVQHPPTQLSDYPHVQQTVRDLVTMLQSYGPLTLGQLEYNLPASKGGKLSDILEVLLVVGAVQKVATISKQDTTPADERYCVNRGVPRPYDSTIRPSTLSREIIAAHNQAQGSIARVQVLLNALQAPNSDFAMQPRQVLKRLLADYPEILQDPVYVTALRSCNVDMTGGTNTSSSTKRSSRQRLIKQQPGTLVNSEAEQSEDSKPVARSMALSGDTGTTSN